MNMSSISYCFAEAFASMRKNIKNVLISISTMIATMLIIAVGYLIVQNSNYIIKQKQEFNSKVFAFLDISISEEQKNNIRTNLDAIEGVKTEFFNQEDAISMAGNFDEMLVYGFSEEELYNLYPPFFRITFESVEAEEKVMNVLKKSEGIGIDEDGNKDIRITESAIKSIKEAKAAVIIAATAMWLIIILSVFLMINSTKLMLYARRKEISIMKYVGAKDGFVKAPFAIEGVISALIAVIIVCLIIYFCYNGVIDAIGKKSSYNYLELSEVMGSLRLLLIAVGCFIGIFGSTMSMNKYLDV